MASAATNMLIAAARAGVDSVVAVPQHGDANGGSSPRALIDLLEPAGVAVQAMPPLRWPAGAAYRWGMSPAQIAWTARHVSDFDIVHVHGVWGMAPVGGLLAGRMARRPIVVTPHESLTTFDIDGSRSRARRRQKLLLKRLYLRHTTLFLLTSQLEASVSLPPAAQQRIVPYPLFDDTAAELPARPTRGVDHELRVGFLGRIDPKKNLNLLVDAMACLPEHVTLVIAGTGPDALVGRLRRRAEELGVGQRLEWLGFVAPRDRQQILMSLDLLVMPSAFESFGLAAAEAMLHGVPVLVSERTGIAELIRRHAVAGQLTTPDVSGIVQAITELDGDRGILREMGAHGQAAVSEELSYGQIGQALHAAYQSLVRDPTSRRRIPADGKP